MVEHYGCYHAVGQGQFFSGHLLIDHKMEFNYVVDCGNVGNRKKLHEEINHFKKRVNHLDLFVISHFDADHFNGISMLADMSIDTIMMPYLEPWERVLLGLKLQNDRRLAVDMKGFSVEEFVVDPCQVLQHLNVKAKRIIYVLPPEWPINDLPICKKEQQNDDVIQKYISYDDLTIETLFPQKKHIHDIIHLKFFRLMYHRQSLTRLLDREINQKKLREITVEDIEAMLRHRDRLKYWRAIYLPVQPYLHTMSLCLAVTTTYESENYRLRKNVLNEIKMMDLCSTRNRFGYLFTGDLSLNLEKDWQQFKLYYTKELQSIQCVTVPQHGSKEAWNPQLSRLMNETIFVACSGFAQPIYHPSDVVVNNILEHQAHELIWVNEHDALTIKTILTG